jgi:hypothetical protein
MVSGQALVGEEMAGKAWSIDWEFEKRAVCLNRGTDAVQKVELLPVKTTVTCANRGAERHYTLHRVDLPDEKPVFEKAGYRLLHDVWDPDYATRCSNCGNCVDNEVNVDERRIRTFYPECYFTRSYEFNMYTESRSRR